MVINTVMSRYVANTVIAITTAIFFLWLYFTTPHGLGLSADAVAYVKAAMGMINGKGFSLFSSQWPPLYPFLIGVLGLGFHNDPILAARILQALLFSLNYVLTYLILRSTQTLSWFVCLIFASLLCLHWSIVYVHYYAWSEPLFILCVLLDLFLLQKFLINKQVSNSWLFYALLTTSIAAVFTRYLGLAVAMTNAAAIIMMTAVPMRERLFKAAVQFVVPCLLIAPWLNYRSSFQDANTAGAFAFQGPSVDRLVDGLANVGRWLMPNTYQAYQDGGGLLQQFIGLLLLLIIIGALVSTLKNTTKNSSDTISPSQRSQSGLFSVALFSIVYIGALLFFIFFMVTTFKLENRYLASVFLPAMITLIVVSSQIKKDIIKWFVLYSIGFCLTLSYPQFRATVLISYFNGIELNSRSVLEKPLNKFIAGCPNKARIGADYPWHFDLRFDDKVTWLPRSIYYGSHKLNPTFKDELAELSSKVDLVVVEDKNSELISFLNKDIHFRKIYDADGSVWLRSALTRDFCKEK